MTNITVGSAYKQASVAGQWDAIVIGSGMGGLTAAALLARHGGKRVLVLERHYVAGGFTHAFHRPGYQWDVGVHYIGQVQDPASPLRPIFDHITRGRLKWSPMPDVYDRIRIAGREYEFVAGLEQFRDHLKSYFPGETAAIDRYLQVVRSCAGRMSMYLAEKALPRSLARVAGPLLRGPFCAGRGALPLTFFPRSPLTANWPGCWLRSGVTTACLRGRAVSACTPLSRRTISTAPVFPWGSLQLCRQHRTWHRIGRRADCVQRRGSRSPARPRPARRGRADAGRPRVPAGTVISDAGAWNTFASLLPPEAPGVAPALAELRSVPLFHGPPLPLRGRKAERRGVGPDRNQPVGSPHAGS